MLSQTPAEVAQLSRVGRIESGYRADFLVFDKNLQLQRTFIAGKESYSNNNHII